MNHLNLFAMTKFEKGGDIFILVLEAILVLAKTGRKLRSLFTQKTT
jgi:hypothetical protein